MDLKARGPKSQSKAERGTGKPRYKERERDQVSPGRLSSLREGIDKGPGRPDKKLGTLKFSSVSGLELELAQREQKRVEGEKAKA